jgi:hypothetical protein
MRRERSINPLVTATRFSGGIKAIESEELRSE